MACLVHRPQVNSKVSGIIWQDVQPKIFFARKPSTVYLQYKLGDQVTRFQLSKTEHPIRMHKERVLERVPLVQNGNSKVLQVITDTEPVVR